MTVFATAIRQDVHKRHLVARESDLVAGAASAPALD